jgi:hypothetical protein
LTNRAHTRSTVVVIVIVVVVVDVVVNVDVVPELTGVSFKRRETVAPL